MNPEAVESSAAWALAAIVAAIATNNGLKRIGKRTCGKAPWSTDNVTAFEVLVVYKQEGDAGGFKTTTKKSR